MTFWLCKTFEWVTMTPFGEPVAPDVYWRMAMSVPLDEGGFQSGSAPLNSPVVETICDGCPFNCPLTLFPSEAVVNTTAGSASLMIDLGLSMARPCRAGSTGTAVAPA